jgi:MFS family permease
MAGTSPPVPDAPGQNVITTEADAPQKEQPWPSSYAAYIALAVIILATFLNFFDATVFSMLAERIKASFQLTDEQLGFLGGPANIIFYVFVGIPLARLADVYRRKYVLAGGISVIGFLTALGGLAQNFWQIVGTRMFVGAGGSAHGPASYSLIADAFPPKKITRAFALLQLGFIGGSTLGLYIGGKMIAHVSSWPDTMWMGFTIHNWQWILFAIGIPGMLIGGLFLMIKEPIRRLPVSNDPIFTPPSRDASLGRRLLTLMGLDAARAIHVKGTVYYPLFIGLALSATHSLGLAFWQAPFMIRTYGWSEEKIGEVLAPSLFVAALIGILFGGVFVEWLAKRYSDANVRASFILFAFVTAFSIAAPLMPTGELAVVAISIAYMFGIAGAVPQNAAIQRIAPQQMRGQVTAIYLFMFTFFGAMGIYVIGFVAQRIVGDPEKLWLAVVISAGILLPVATYCMYKAMRPYREEVDRMEGKKEVLS